MGLVPQVVSEIKLCVGTALGELAELTDFTYTPHYYFDSTLDSIWHEGSGRSLGDSFVVSSVVVLCSGIRVRKP